MNKRVLHCALKESEQFDWQKMAGRLQGQPLVAMDTSKVTFVNFVMDNNTGERSVLDTDEQPVFDISREQPVFDHGSADLQVFGAKTDILDISTKSWDYGYLDKKPDRNSFSKWHTFCHRKQKGRCEV